MVGRDLVYHAETPVNQSFERRDVLLDRALVADVRAGLTMAQKQVAPIFLYDALGSRLFSTICGLPWYTLSRAEMRLLGEHAAAMASALRGPVRVIELGPGGGEKVARLVEVLEHQQVRVDLDLIDVSIEALERAMERFKRARKVFARYHVGVYEECLDAALAGPTTERRLIAFLGSNLGNFGPDAAVDFLSEIRRRMRPGDGLLVGVDLIKEPERLLLAYNDPLGVTAAFNRNLLVRLNRELGADFRIECFRHEARWSETDNRIEMHLVSKVDQFVHLPGAELMVRFEKGESIWTEASHKYTLESLDALMVAAGFQLKDRWLDQTDSFVDALYWVPTLSLVD